MLSFIAEEMWLRPYNDCSVGHHATTCSNAWGGFGSGALGPRGGTNPFQFPVPKRGKQSPDRFATTSGSLGERTNARNHTDCYQLAVQASALTAWPSTNRALTGDERSV
ncbi:hypothetical protein Pla52o_07370 [Novipirellula galeiformis]|uniref:Uncharacterized protein n=1 Tax=Novipirellula galeiformis TaxID=2528004 RepID=A0A5C6CR06_9BACT|nr:hypothetical protein Pla52o_07370 [Novipirellula galeiformis]